MSVLVRVPIFLCSPLPLVLVLFSLCRSLFVLSLARSFCLFCILASGCVWIDPMCMHQPDRWPQVRTCCFPLSAAGVRGSLDESTVSFEKLVRLRRNEDGLGSATHCGACDPRGCQIVRYQAARNQRRDSSEDEFSFLSCCFCDGTGIVQQTTQDIA